MSEPLSDMELVHKYLYCDKPELKRLAVIAASGLEVEEVPPKTSKEVQLELNLEEKK